MKRSVKGLIVVVAVLSIVGIAGMALADWGYGRGGGMGRGYRAGDCPGYGAGNGYGNQQGNRGRFQSQLSDEEIAALEKEREAFLKETETLRTEMEVQSLALRSELAKKTPDAQKAAELQKALSELESQFSQKRLNHMLRVREINPDLGHGFSGRGFKGRGNHGRGYMAGGFGNGNCRR